MRIVIAALAALLAGCGNAEPGAGSAAEETPALRFALCASNVVSVDRAESSAGDKYALHVGLAPDAATAFAQLTGDNVGRDLAVTYGDAILLAAPIPGRIASGVITAAPLDAAEAQRVERALASLPAAPCGVVQASGS
jgi:preprotein translocase subunit SecD